MDYTTNHAIYFGHPKKLTERQLTHVKFPYGALKEIKKQHSTK